MVNRKHELLVEEIDFPNVGSWLCVQWVSATHALNLSAGVS